MAMSGKKGKKAKGKTLNLQDFLSENGGAASGSVVTKSLSWANECEDDDYAPPKIVTYNIPTAPRSQRVLDESTIPQNPPYLAHISNLSFDLNETDIQEYFEHVTHFDVVSVRLPREDGDTGRMRGFGYIEFAEREGLIAAVSIPDLQLRNRNIRIDVSNEQEQKRSGGNRGRYDNFGSSSEPRDANWRRGGDNGPDSGRRGGDRSSSGVENGGNWRSDRPKMDSSPPARRDRERDRYGGDRGGRNWQEPVLAEERPRLKLQPRTLPLPEFNLQIDERDKADDRDKSTSSPPPPPQPQEKPKPVPSAAIFGAAKPVDTAAKDREIEERLERERLERLERFEREEKEAKLQAEKELDEASNTGATPEKPEESDTDQPNGDELDEPSVEKKAPIEKPEIISWRRKPEDDGRPSSPTRKRFSPDRSRRPSDNRDRRNNRDRDNNRNNFNRDKRDYNRDYHPRNDRNDRNQQRNHSRNYNNRDSRDNRDHRDNRDNRGPPPPPQQRDDRDKQRRAMKPEEIENRMPKFKPDVKPKLQMSNAYAFLNDDISE